MEKKYWQSLEEYSARNGKSVLETEPQPEFSVEGLDESEIKGKSSRRDFLKMLGFSVGTVALVSSCQMPVRKAIPLLNQPDELIPGIPNFYASTFYDGHDFCSVLVKTRENRPIIQPLPVEGAYVIGALSGFGIMAAPAAGELLAAHLTKSDLPPYSTWFTMDRYDDPTYQSLLETWDDSGQL